jgi:hypothetical protein
MKNVEKISIMNDSYRNELLEEFRKTVWPDLVSEEIKIKINETISTLKEIKSFESDNVSKYIRKNNLPLYLISEPYLLAKEKYNKKLTIYKQVIAGEELKEINEKFKEDQDMEIFGVKLKKDIKDFFEKYNKNNPGLTVFCPMLGGNPYYLAISMLLQEYLKSKSEIEIKEMFLFFRGSEEFIRYSSIDKLKRVVIDELEPYLFDTKEWKTSCWQKDS